MRRDKRFCLRARDIFTYSITNRDFKEFKMRARDVQLEDVRISLIKLNNKQIIASRLSQSCKKSRLQDHFVKKIETARCT